MKQHAGQSDESSGSQSETDLKRGVQRGVDKRVANLIDTKRCHAYPSHQSFFSGRSSTIESLHTKQMDGGSSPFARSLFLFLYFCEKPKTLIMAIHEKIKSLMSNVPNPIVFELGAHRGEDTAKLASIPNSIVHAFECDERNHSAFAKKPNIVLNKYAISDVCGVANFNISEKENTASGSLREPKVHLSSYPYVKFSKGGQVNTITLDFYCKKNNIDHIDFIWADIQGCEDKMINGGIEILKQTKYIYTEYSDHELYAGQLNQAALLEMLPDFKIILDQQNASGWYADMLLVNTKL